MWHPDPDQLALAALPAEQRDQQVHDHLRHCQLCHRHVDSLRHTVEIALSDGRGVFDDVGRPPERVWLAITDELDIVPAPEEPEVVAPVVPLRPRRWRRLALPVAAAVVGVAAGLGIGALLSAQPSGPVVAQLAPVDGESTGTGRVELVDGGEARTMRVSVDGIAGTAGGDYLEAWLMDSSGTRLVSLGALRPDGPRFRGDFTVPADLPMAEFGTVDISAERWDGDPTHSRLSVLRGPVT